VNLLLRGLIPKLVLNLLHKGMMMHKTFTAIFIVDSLAAVFVVAQSFIVTFSQVTVPSVSNQWQLIAFVALLAFNAYAMYVQSQKSAETQKKIEESSVATQGKVEEVHKTVNSKLDMYKKEAADQYKLALENGIAIVKATLQKEYDAKTTALESRITILEVKLDTEKLKSIALAKSVPASVDPVKSVEPAEPPVAGS
jgi:membrane protein implicated in regulation of membrane protease activity